MGRKKNISGPGKTKSNIPAKTHEQEFTEVVGIIQKSRQKALHAVNTELIDLYWQVGEYLSRKVNDAGWGQAVVRQLAHHIQKIEPNSKGFSAQNLWRMKQFYETYAADEKLSALLRELPWTHNMLILSKSISDEEREFYLNLTIREHYSSRQQGFLCGSAFLSPRSFLPCRF